VVGTMYALQIYAYCGAGTSEALQIWSGNETP